MNPQNPSQNYNGIQKKAEQVIANVGDEIKSKYVDVKDSVQSFADESVTFVKKYPFYSLAGAAVIGLLAGVFIQNRRS